MPGSKSAMPICVARSGTRAEAGAITSAVLSSASELRVGNRALDGVTANPSVTPTPASRPRLRPPEGVTDR